MNSQEVIDFRNHIQEMVQEDQRVLTLNGVARYRHFACRDTAMDEYVARIGDDVLRVAGSAYALEKTPGKRLGVTGLFRQLTLLESLIAEIPAEDLHGYMHGACGRLFIDGGLTPAKQVNMHVILSEKIDEYNRKHHGHFELRRVINTGSAERYLTR